MNDWSVKWIQNKWVQDYTKSPSWSSGFTNPSDIFERLGHLIMRKEEFGGIVLDPTSDRVYKVNQEGYELLNEIIEKAKEGPIKSFTSKRYSEKEIEPFIYFLKGAGLWPM